MAIEFITIVWRMSPYAGEKLIVHLALADWADLGGEFYPSYREIAAKARISKPGAVGIVKAMIEDEEIEVIQNGGGRRHKNRYRFAEKYRAAVEELCERWASKRIEKAKDAPFPQKRVKEDDPLKRVKEDDPFPQKRVKENIKRVNENRSHVRNKPSCMPVMHETVMQQQHGKPRSKNQKAAAGHAAAAKSFGDPDSEPHASRHTFQQIRAYCESTKLHARNPAGLARFLYRTGQEDAQVAAWLDREKEKAARKSAPPAESGFDFDFDQYVAALLKANDVAQLRYELEGINERGGPSAEWERKVVEYFERAARGAA